MYEKIIVATDGSKTAAMAVAHAADLAAIAGTKEVVVLHVCPGCTADVDPELKNKEMADNIVEEAGKQLSAKGVPFRTVIEMDYPPEEVGEAILDITNNEKADLLILGSRGLSEFRGLLLGSVSHRVLQRAGCPVLVIKGEE